MSDVIHPTGIPGLMLRQLKCWETARISGCLSVVSDTAKAAVPGTLHLETGRMSRPTAAHCPLDRRPAGKWRCLAGLLVEMGGYAYEIY